jgi:hypothetical protein
LPPLVATPACTGHAIRTHTRGLYSPKCLEEVRLLKNVLWSEVRTVPVA